jgi:hypothetical protein
VLVQKPLQAVAVLTPKHGRCGNVRDQLLVVVAVEGGGGGVCVQFRIQNAYTRLVKWYVLTYALSKIEHVKQASKTKKRSKAYTNKEM